ncbi:MAG: cation diffusion facilitator family transporter [Geminicoccaceae bacterium]
MSSATPAGIDRASQLAAGSVAVGLVVLALKFAAWWLTGSVALFSDALESIINVVAAGIAYVALRVSARPADANHPYGHHKAEYFSAVIEGVLIVLAAIAILREAYFAYISPRPLDAPVVGLVVNGVASVLNALWCWLLIDRGKRWRSPALVADGKHLLADVVTSIGVLVGVGLVALTGWLVLDPALAALVALNILWSGGQLVRESVSGLMDEAASPELLARIKEVIATHGEGAIEAHDVRTRHAGKSTFIDFHLVVPGDMRVAESHAICDRIEAALKEDVDGARIIIHVEPEEKAKHKGMVVL